MKKIKSDKGITLTILVITIIVMMILIIPIGTSITSNVEVTNFNNFKQDIISLTEEVKSYYVRNKQLPVDKGQDYNLINLGIPPEAINQNDKGKYYPIDLGVLTNENINDIRLNYGNGNKQKRYATTKDTYVINENTLTVYYLKGIEFEGKKYYSLKDKFTAESENYSKVNLPIIPVVKLENNEKNKRIVNKGDILTLTIISNYGISEYDEPKPIVKINNNNVQITWNGKEGKAIYKYDGEDVLFINEIPIEISNISVNGRREADIKELTFK